MDEFTIMLTGALLMLLLGIACISVLFSAALVVLKILAVMMRVIRNPPAARHRLMWVYALFSGYFFFPVLYGDAVAAGSSIRSNHDALAIGAWNDLLFWGVMAAATLPVVPLFFRGTARREMLLGTAWAVWLVLFAELSAVALLLGLGSIDAFARVLAWLFDVFWFWWDGLLKWMEAGGVKTQQYFAQPKLRYGWTLVWNGIGAAVVSLPFWLLVNQDAADNKQEEATGPLETVGANEKPF